MKSTRSSSGSARKRASSIHTDEGSQDKSPLLRRSSREREVEKRTPTTPASPTPKPPRSTRSARKDSSTPAQRPGSTGKTTRSSIRDKSPAPALPLSASKNPPEDLEDNPQLIAVDKAGRLQNVNLIVGGVYFTPDAASSGEQGLAQGTYKKAAPNFMGHDGNFYYCVNCRECGDVVCCDGCPAVFHPKCIPEGSKSRISLENDEDPWFCPECIEKKTPVKQVKQVKQMKQESEERRSEGSTRRTIKYRCQECKQTRPDLSLLPCEVCAVHIHHPPCRGFEASSSPPDYADNSVLCSSCRAEEAVNQEEMEHHAQKKRKIDKHRAETTPVHKPSAVNRSSDVKEEPTDSKVLYDVHGDGGGDNYANTHEEQDSPMADLSANRKRPGDASPAGDTPTPKSEKKKSKKKKKRKRDSDAHLPVDEVSGAVVEPNAEPIPDGDGEAVADGSAQPMRGPPTQATPAFHFYLVEQRPKIEKVLSRKHRYFARLTKGGERNALIAKEAAMQWVKLSSVDQKKYISMSMRDYESRIIAWKEEKNIRDMLSGGGATGATLLEDAVDEDKQHDDSALAVEMHDRLYLGTSVGSKPYKPEADQSHNRVLLDLLRDMRFHPLPMLSVSRPKQSAKSQDSQKVSIRHFDVHGPIATSVGDECLGCSRGWPHFCPVLKRRIPAIEQRSKLQPAASALINTRVGLGLRPRLERIEMEEHDEEEGSAEKPELLSWREAPESKELRNVRFVPSGTLAHPSSRADDVVEFIEEVVAMKIPEPPRPSRTRGKPGEATPKKSSLVRGILPTRHKRTADVLSSEYAEKPSYETINKCGRCRTIIMNESGCTQCRRAQLVINMSKRQIPAPVEQQSRNLDTESLLKVQTAMLGRVITKDAIGDGQSDADKTICNAILKERWTPCAVLSATPKPTAPSKSVASVKEDESSIAVKNTGSSAFDLKHTGHMDSEALPRSVANDPSTDDRSRNSRRSTTAHEVFDNSDHNRQAVAKQQKEQADKINKRTLSIACSGILLALMRRDPLLLFAQPVTAPGYSAIVKRPMDFGKMRHIVLRNSYHTLGAFVSDARLLCENALIFNPPGSIYWKTAKELLEVLLMMQKRASRWISAIKNAHASFWRKVPKKRKRGEGAETESSSPSDGTGDPFKQLRQTWPEAVDMYENSDWMKSMLSADFTRTRENETAYYGAISVRRAARAAEACLAPYTDTGGAFTVVVKRSTDDDEDLRQAVDSKVGQVIDPVQLRDIATGREETIVRLMRRVQSRRLEHRIGSDNGCARCDGMGLDHEMKAVMNADIRWGRNKKKGDGSDPPDTRVAASRLDLTTGLASANTRDRIAKLRELDPVAALDSINDVCVSLRGSRIHGWGLYAEQPFKKGDAVAEYVGECVSMPVADAREKMYREMRIQDYQFRLSESQIIDATLKGGLGRYVNHRCTPNCFTKVVPGKPPNQHLRRVIIVAQRDIEPREELTYDYQFPLELNLKARIPCNCQSDACRGFMNWDLPEKGANTGHIRTQKRGANMRDRIRRLGRPLKK